MKLAAAVGAIVGLTQRPLATALALVVGLTAAVLSGKLTGHRDIALGPYLAGGALSTILVGRVVEDVS